MTQIGDTREMVVNSSIANQGGIADMVVECLNPATGQVMATLPVPSEAEVEAKIDAVAGSLEFWQSLSFRERARYITRARKHLVFRMDEVMETVRNETGKSDFDGIVEIVATGEIMRFVARRGPSILSSEKRRIGLLKTKRGYIRYEPYGVVGIISPWNYPLILVAGPVSQALMAGNGVILKPSEFTSLTALKFKEILDESGFPKDLVQVAIGAGETGKTVVNSSRVKLVCFTGSVEVGRRIAVACAEQLKPVILELGGKDPLIVLEDANLERAARAAVWGGLHNAGQTCISVERVYVEESVAEQFIERVVALAKSVRWKHDESNPDVGCMMNERQLNAVMAQLTDARQKGARILVGNEHASGSDGLYLKPSVVVDIDETMEIMNQETFGPIIAISKVIDEDEALQKANSLEFGLNASIFTSDIRRGRSLAHGIQAGNVCINDVLSNYLCPELPFGGVGASGMGRLQGAEGLKNFARTKAICEDRFGLKKELWWFPVSSVVKKGFRAIARLRYG